MLFIQINSLFVAWNPVLSEDSLLIAGLDFTQIVADNKRVKFSNLEKGLRLRYR